jgi:hypothetical protein
MGSKTPRINNKPALAEQQRAREQAEKDRLRWEAEQSQIQQQRQSTYAQNENELKAAEAQRIAEETRYKQDQQAQQTAVGATGGASGIKAANTMVGRTLMDPAQEKIGAAGIGLSSLANLLKKRNTTQGNFTGMGNSLTPNNVTLGGT